VPGVPDIYQGNETWDLSLVDPDNRRPVDYRRNGMLLESIDADRSDSKTDLAAYARDLVEHKENGSIKLYVTSQTLRFRREHAALFADGTYQPLEANGPRADHVVAFARRLEDQEIVVAVPRLLTKVVRDNDAPLGDVWDGDVLLLPHADAGTRYTNLFTGERLEVDEIDGQIGLPVKDVFANMAVALLVKQ
jgi:(1->4)-alpha-D-glucan 1-alpha-D-glucosylmutase